MASAHAPRQRYDGIDLLRIGAALAVVFFHYAFRGAAAGGFTTFQLPSLAPVAQYCYLGVELFFIISGFVIVMTAEGRSVGAFARSRVLRIYPTFIAAMTVTALVTAAIGSAPFTVSPTGWLANLTLFPTLLGRPFVDGVYWTLELEVVFYCWVTLFIWLGWFERRRTILVAAWLGLSLVVDAVSSSKPLHAVFLTEAAPFFAGGMLLYDIKRFGPTIGRVLLFTSAVAMSARSALAGAAYERNVLHSTLDDGVLVCIVVALYAIFIASLALPRLSRLGRLVGFAGAASYPLYLLHQHIGYMLFNLLGSAFAAPLTGLLVVTAVVIGAVAFTLWVEPPARFVMGRLFDFAMSLQRARQAQRAAPFHMRQHKLPGDGEAATSAHGVSQTVRLLGPKSVGSDSCREGTRACSTDRVTIGSPRSSTPLQTV